MAVGGGVCVASPSSSPSSSVEAAWGTRRTRTTTTTSGARRGAAAAATSVRCSIVGEAGGPGASGRLAEDPYRTLRLRPGATRGEVKKAFRRLALMYHPDVRKEKGRESDGVSDVQFQRINVAYQMVMSSMREADERLEYWRLKYGLTDEDLDRYRHHLNQEHGDDDWFDM